jgi:microcystin-dependent protein
MPSPDALSTVDPGAAGHVWPIGAVIPYAGTVQGGDGVADQILAILARQGWLYCDGKAYPQKDYWLLHGVIGSNFGGDANNFNVPDLRGRFVRGVDAGAGRDADASGRTASGPGGATGDSVGSAQADAFQGHEHLYISTVESPNTAQPGGPPMLMQLPDQITTSVVADQAGDGQPRVAKETRPVNLNLNYLIRYC